MIHMDSPFTYYTVVGAVTGSFVIAVVVILGVMSAIYLFILVSTHYIQLVST